MLVPLLRETTILVIFCNIFVETQDFLEYYEPKPGLPKELNEWLSDVQQYKSDFRLIRAIAEKQEKEGLDYDVDTLADTHIKLFDNLEEENEYLDEVPKNDIYPHMYKQKHNPYENFGTSFEKSGKNKKYSSKNLRQRRHSNKDILPDKLDIDVNPKSDDGEIKKSDDKYPDRYYNSLQDNANRKREIQIDVLNDGKLVKQIKENDEDPKSIVLNIQSLDKLKNPPPAYKPEPIAMENEASQVKPSDSQGKLSNAEVKPQESQVKLLDSHVMLPDSQAMLSDSQAFPAQRSAEPEVYQTNIKELSNNMKNLFNANENLNTDSSIAREKLGQTALLYRVTLPDPNLFYIPDQEKTTIKEDNQGGFNRNGLKDMSRFWTATEKNQMQKGIDYARGEWNEIPLQRPQQSIDNDGFELVKSVVMEADSMKEKPKQNPVIEGVRQNKRESQTIEGRVRINTDEGNKNVIYNADLKSSQDRYDNYNPENKYEESLERKCVSEQKITTPNVVLIDSQSGNKIMEGAIESIQTIDEHSYDQDNIGSNRRSNDPSEKSSLDCNVPPDASIDYKLNEGDIGKIEVIADSNVDDLIPEEYRETTPEFIIPAPEGETLRNLQDFGMQNDEEKQIQLGVEESPEHEPIDGIRAEGNEAVEPHKDTFDPMNLSQGESEVTVGPIDEGKHHRGHKEELNPHPANMFPLTKIHEVNQDIHDHLVVTRIETVTILDRRPETGDGELDENDDQEMCTDSDGSLPEPRKLQHPLAPECSGNTNRHHKIVKIFTKPLSKHPKHHKGESLVDRDAPPVPRETNRLSMKSRRCEGGNCAQEDENMERVMVEKKMKTKKKKRKRRKHKRYRDKIRYNEGRDENDAFLQNDSYDIPALGRHLQGVEYVYDVDIGPKGEEHAELAEISSTYRNMKIGMLHKNSVEGDYGDEEDSMTKEKKEKSKLTKKTDNKFANPVVATTEDDDDDEEYYEESTEVNDTNSEEGQAPLSNSQELASFGRRLHKQAKPPKKGDENKKRTMEKSKKIREIGESPRHRFLDKSEFQRWPQFVISDKINEENLRKRSLAVKKTEPKRDIFPLSSKDYFPQANQKVRDSLQLDDAFDKSTTRNPATTEKPFMDFDQPKDHGMEMKLNLNLNMDQDLKPGEINDLSLFSISNPTTDGNQSVSSTEEEECDSEKVSVGNVCEENENFNKTKVALTTVLSIIPDTQGEMSNETYNKADDFVKLDDMLTGRLPFKILEYIRAHMRKDKILRDRFLKGMKKSHSPETFQNLPDVTNDETKKLINAMASLMNRLQITSTCQTLPSKLMHYVRSATKVRLEDTLARAKEMEEVELDDIQNQDTFIFQSNSRADNLEEKVRVLKDLLAKYNNLPDRCKPRAEPVREYVMNHLKLLTNMLSVAQLSPPRPKKTVQGPFDNNPSESLREPPGKSTTEKDLVEQQLESLGLGSQHNFKPKFSLDDLIEDSRSNKEMSMKIAKSRAVRNKKVKRDMDKDNISEKYEKLRDAVKKERTKRDSERRVAENFGRLNIGDYNGEEAGNFESPLVFSF